MMTTPTEGKPSTFNHASPAEPGSSKSGTTTHDLSGQVVANEALEQVQREVSQAIAATKASIANAAHKAEEARQLGLQQAREAIARSQESVIRDVQNMHAAEQADSQKGATSGVSTAPANLANPMDMANKVMADALAASERATQQSLQVVDETWRQASVVAPEVPVTPVPVPSSGHPDDKS